MPEFSPNEIENREHIAPDKTGDNIAAKKVATYVWNGSTWARATQAGAAQDYVVLIDDQSPITYVGKANPGSVSSAASWQIRKLDETTGLVMTYADGDASYDNVWTNRASLTYS